MDSLQRAAKGIRWVYGHAIDGARRSAEWLRTNPLAILLLFPFVATPERFARTQRNGVTASLLATAAMLWTASGFWSSAMQESFALIFRRFESEMPAQSDEAVKQQFELVIAATLGKPIVLAAAGFLLVIACCKAAWYRAFIAVYYRREGLRPMVGLHYFLVQSASTGLYLGAVAYAVTFAMNNWTWLESPMQSVLSAGYLTVPMLALGLLQLRYFRHKALVDRQLYGSWLAEALSTVLSLIATIAVGCTVMWLIGLWAHVSAPSVPAA